MTSTLLAIIGISMIQTVVIGTGIIWLGRIRSSNRLEDRKDRALVAEEVQKTHKTMEAVHKAVNSNYADLTKELKEAREEITQLSKMLVKANEPGLIQ